MSTPGTLHPQVAVPRGDTTVSVDEALAPLLGALWKLGIETVMSCQHYDPDSSAGYGTGRPLVWIVFRTERDTKRFLKLAPPGGLEFEIRPVTVAQAHAAQVPPGDPSLAFVGKRLFHVLFPRPQLRAVTRAIVRRSRRA